MVRYEAILCGGGIVKSSKSIVLNKGDVIKTNPQNGYWGCALVLDVQEHNDEFQPLC